MSDQAGDDVRRWYRNTNEIWLNYGIFGIVCGVLGAGMIVAGALGGPAPLIPIGAVLAVGGAYLLAQCFKAGIGVGTRGVTVRSTLGRSQWVPWPEVEGFQPFEPKSWRGGAHLVLVVCRTRKPLRTGGCIFALAGRTTSKGYTLNRDRMNQMIQSLEAERPAVQ